MPPRLLYHRLLTHLRGSCPDVGSWAAQRFALFVVGILVARHPALPRLAAALRQVTPTTLAASIERRLRRALADPHLDDPRRLFVPLARHALAALPPGPCYLMLDDTPQTDTGAQLTMLALSYGGRALPLAWVRWVGPLGKGVYWAQVAALFRQAQAILPAQVQPLLLADRGLGCAALAQLALAQGWDYLLRLPADRTIRVAGPEGTVAPGTPRVALRTLLTTPGATLAVTWRLFAHTPWDAAVVATWQRDHREPWFLMTNRRPDPALAPTYARRMQVEALFRDAKRGGVSWEASRVRARPRATRLLLALMTALFCAVLLGEAAARAGERPPYGHRSQAVSLLQRGLAWLWAPSRSRYFRWTLAPPCPSP